MKISNKKHQVIIGTLLLIGTIIFGIQTYATDSINDDLSDAYRARENANKSAIEAAESEATINYIGVATNLAMGAAYGASCNPAVNWISCALAASHFGQAAIHGIQAGRAQSRADQLRNQPGDGDGDGDGDGTTGDGDWLIRAMAMVMSDAPMVVLVIRRRQTGDTSYGPSRSPKWSLSSE